MTELEKKMLLTKEEYVILMSRFGYESPAKPKPVVKQINYYYDTLDLSMNRQNITCRIRLKDGKYKGIIKSHLPGSCQSTERVIKVSDGIRKNEFTDMGMRITVKDEIITAVSSTIIRKDFETAKVFLPEKIAEFLSERGEYCD